MLGKNKMSQHCSKHQCFLLQGSRVRPSQCQLAMYTSAARERENGNGTKQIKGASFLSFLTCILCN